MLSRMTPIHVFRQLMTLTNLKMKWARSRMGKCFPKEISSSTYKHRHTCRTIWTCIMCAKLAAESFFCPFAGSKNFTHSTCWGEFELGAQNFTICWSNPNIDTFPSIFFSSLKTQTQLLQNCWIELFFIGYAQSSHSVSLPTVISSLSNTVEGAITQEKMAPNKLKRLSEHIWKINDFFQEISRMNLDDFEFAFLRFIILFNPGMTLSIFVMTWISIWRKLY